MNNNICVIIIPFTTVRILPLLSVIIIYTVQYPYVGYFNKACTSLSAWATESGDVTSVSVAPQFLDSTVSLELASAGVFGCPLLQGVN